MVCNRCLRFVVALSLFASAVGLHKTFAATETWVGLGSDNNWKTGANWSGGSGPAAGDILVFDGANRFAPNDNEATNFNVGGIVFSSTAAGPFVLGPTSNTINLNGNISDNSQSFIQTINTNVALQTTPTINIAQFGNLVISTPISQIGGPFGLNETGQGTLTLSASNSFSGAISVGNGATLSISSDGNLGAVPGSPTNDLDLAGGGALQTTANMTLNANRSIALGPGGATFNVASGTTLTYAGTLSDNGGAGGINKISFGTMVLSGSNNSYTGPTTVANGQLTLDFTQGTSPTSNIINSASALTLGGLNAGLGNTSYARLVMTGSAGITNTQTFNGTTIQVGPAVIRADSGASGTANLNLGAITNVTGGVVTFVQPTAGAISTTSSNVNGILGGWAVIQSGTGQVVNNITQGQNFATVDGSNHIVTYTGYTPWTSGNANGFGGTANVQNTTGASLVVAPDNTGTVDINTLELNNVVNTQAISVGVGNTLRFGATGGILVNSNRTVTMYMGETGPTQHDVGFITAGAHPNTAGTLVITVNSNDESSGAFRLGSIVEDNGTGALTLVKAGAGNIKIDGHNTYTGGTYILQGRVQMTGGENGGTVNPDALGTGPVYISPGGYLFPGTFAMTNPFFIAGIGTGKESIGAIRFGNGTDIQGLVTLTGDARVGNGDGSTTGPFTGISGQVTGNYNFDLGAASSVASNFTISNHLNNWTGNTTIVGRTGGTPGNTVVHLGNDEVIPNGVGFGNLLMGLNSDTASTETVDLNGHNETVNGVVSPSGVTASLTFIENDAASTSSTFTLGDNNQTQTFNGTIRDNAGTGGTVGVTKIGTGVQTLGGANSYSGGTNINNGAISISSTGSLLNTATVSVNTSATAAGSLYGNSTNSVGNVVTQAVNGSHSATISPGLTGIGSVGTLTMDSLSAGGGTTLQFDLGTDQSTTDLIQVNGSTTFSGAATVVNVSGVTNGTFTVVNSNGGFSGTALTLTTPGDTRLTYNFDNASWNPTSQSGATSVIVDVSGTAATLTWTGTGSDSNGVPSDGTTWDVNHTPNWNSSAATHPDLFFNADSVVFDQTGITNGFNTITVTGLVKPGGMTFSHNSGNYIFTGGGSIGGGGALTISGSGTVTMGLNNNFSGGTTLNSGTLNVNATNALGTGTITINGGALDNTSGSPVALSANNQQVWNANITYLGTTSGSLDMGAGAVTLGSLSPSANRTVTVNAGKLTVGGSITDNFNNNGLVVAGSGILALTGANTFQGPVTINSGATLQIGNVFATGSNTSALITIQNGAVLDLGAFAGANAGTAGAGNTQPITVSGSGIGGLGAIINSSNNAQQNALSNLVTMTGDTTVGGLGRFDFRYATGLPGSVNFDLGTHTLYKTGTNQVSFVNAYLGAGNIAVNQGRLSIEVNSIVPNNNDGTSITFADGTIAGFYENTFDGTNSYVQRPMIFNGATLGVTINNESPAATTAYIGSTMTLTGTSTLTISGGGDATSQMIFQGPMQESAGSLYTVTKTGAGTLVLSTSNSYSGGTNLNGGLINFNNLNNLGELVRSPSPAVVCSTPTPVRISTTFRCAR